MWKLLKNNRWNNRKIAFVSILIATSVAFVLIFTRIAPIAALPSFKIMAGGLPIKLTGYIFGPVVGLITGIISDIISFIITPTFIHFWYTLAFAIAGMVPGVVGYFMHRRWKNKGASAPEDEYKYNNINFAITIVSLLTVIAAATAYILFQDASEFKKQKLISNRYIFLGIAVAGISTMLIAVIVFRFIFKPKTFNAFLPIITFSALIELFNTPMITRGDMSVFNLHDDFISLLTAHLLLSPVKIWGNLLVVYFAYKVVAPLIFNRTGNGWEKSGDEILIEEKNERDFKKKQKRQAYLDKKAKKSEDVNILNDISNKNYIRRE